MSERGPKLRTQDNSPGGSAGSVRHDTLESPSPLTPRAQEEYQRLIGMLQSAGTLERVDLGVVAEAARVTDLLDRAHERINQEMDQAATNMVCRFTVQRRGLLRELGLTLQPSRTYFHAKGKPESAEADKWADRLKVG